MRFMLALAIAIAFAASAAKAEDYKMFCPLNDRDDFTAASYGDKSGEITFHIIDGLSLSTNLKVTQVLSAIDEDGRWHRHRVYLHDNGGSDNIYIMDFIDETVDRKSMDEYKPDSEHSSYFPPENFFVITKEGIRKDFHCNPDHVGVD